MTDQTGSSGIVRHQRQIEPDQFGVALDDLEGFLAGADLGGDAVQFIVEYVAKPLGEDQRQDEILVFRRVTGPADGAGRVPDPGFQRLFAGTVAFWRALFLFLPSTPYLCR